jgi:hypothetical protein
MGGGGGGGVTQDAFAGVKAAEASVLSLSLVSSSHFWQ